MNWDIYCRVIDNHGDLGVCYRLARTLVDRGYRTRLIVDDAQALEWMAVGHAGGPQIVSWDAGATASFDPARYVVSGFGCELPAAVMQTLAARAGPEGPPAWVVLEYLSAESYAERSHGLGSYAWVDGSSRARRDFFFPGFTPLTGGLLRDAGLARRQSEFDRREWLAARAVPWQGERVISLFCYEPEALAQVLSKWRDQSLLWLVTPGRSAQAFESAWNQVQASACGRSSAMRWHALPYLDQDDFDHLLWAADLNFVRGEDSLVRAIWAGCAFVWQAYPQNDGAHAAKLDALLDVAGAGGDIRAFQRAWNGLGPLPALDPDWNAWSACVRGWRDQLWAQTDLTSRLLRFVGESS